MTMTIATGWHWRRALAAVATAVAATAGVAVLGLGVPAMASQASASSARVLGAGQTGTRASVPWSRVGPGWALALFSAAQGGEGIKPKAGAVTLYLVDPSGGRYRMFTWSAHSRETGWDLLAWSGDGRRAMFVPYSEVYNTGREQVFQLQLRTGAVTSFRLPANVQAVGYTRPDGLNILAERGGNLAPTATGTLMRFGLTGHLTARLASVRGLGAVAYQPAGAELAAGSEHGLTLVSNAGGVIRGLAVPGVNDGCTAVRWWSARTILASCTVNGQPGPRLWLVPASGARPAALTPVRRNGFDLGDFNAWQLSSGLYVDGLGPCATLVIGRQPASGPEQQVSVPGAASSLIVTATRSSLMVERINGCSPGVSLVWFNPASRAMKVAIGTHGQEDGVVGLVPYFVAGKY
jgi:hypothetical protein